MAKDAVHRWAKKLIVPLHMMPEVAEFISDKGLEHQITGGDDDQETISIEIYYDRHELDEVNELAEMVDDEDDDSSEEE